MIPLWQLDQEAFRAVHEGARRDWLDPFVQVINDMGLGYLQASALVVAAAVGKWPRWGVVVFALAVSGVSVVEEGRPHAAVAFALLVPMFAGVGRPAALCALAAVIASGLVRLAIVPIVGRQRPGNFAFSAPMEEVFGRTSFPSGHATTSFALAVAFAWCLRGADRAWLAGLALAMATLVGFGRVYAGVHYPLDVVGAAGLGASVGTAAYLVWDARGWLSGVSQPETASSGGGHGTTEPIDGDARG